MNFKKPKGTNDIFGLEVKKLNYIENLLKETCRIFGINEIRTPIFEFKDLFTRSVGEASDIVQKEMFTFFDRGNRSYALKPEGTAPAVRAFLEQKLYANTQPTKLFYITPAFRDERNQAGRFKQFHQFGVEIFGSYDASADAEVLSFMSEFFNKLNLKNITLNLNNLGGQECRKNYNIALKDYLSKNIEHFCEDCKTRYERNTMRVLDCKNPSCQEKLIGSPIILDFLEDDSREHFANLQIYLRKMGIDFEINPKIIRGLDYYTNTVFEFVCNSENLSSQSTICGGGRYDNLVSQFGGSNTGAVGLAMGLERLMILLDEQKINILEEDKTEVYIVYIGDNALIKAQQICFDLRKDGIKCEYDILKRSVKAQMKHSDKIGSKFTVVIGENEIETNSVNLKNMQLSEQTEIKLSELKNEILKRR